MKSICLYTVDSSIVSVYIICFLVTSNDIKGTIFLSVEFFSGSFFIIFSIFSEKEGINCFLGAIIYLTESFKQ